MIIILDNLRSAHNVGSIVRTCDGLGIKDIYFCGITPEAKEVKVRKTSLGAENNINAKYFNSTLEAIKFARERNFKIIGLEISTESIPINKLNIKDHIALVVGNEVSGITNDIISECDIVANIPMKGIKKSFNVSIAFAIAAYSLTLDK